MKERNVLPVYYCYTVYSIKGPFNWIDWIDALGSNTFKESLVNFLSEYGRNDTLAQNLGENVLYANFNGKMFYMQISTTSASHTTEMEST